MAESVAQRFARLFRPGRGGDLSVVVGSDDAALPPPQQLSDREPSRGPFSSPGSLFGQRYDDERDRIGAYRDYRVIDANVPEVSRALTIIATNATCGAQMQERSFAIEWAEGADPRKQQIAEDLVVRTALDQQLRPMIRAKNKFGDVFRHVVVDRAGLIWRLRPLVPELTTRVHDEYDRLEKFQYKGYAQQEQDLPWWEVIHVRNDPEDGSRYGRSLLAGGGRSLAHRLLTIRDATTYEVLVHCTARMAVFLPRPPGLDPARRRAWLREMGEAFSREHVVGSDGMLVRRAITMLNSQHVIVDYAATPDGKGAVPTIHDLQPAPLEKGVMVAEHFQGLLLVLLGVPRSYMGIRDQGDGLGSQRSDKQDIQLARQLNGDQHDGAWFVSEVLRRQFVLLGMPVERDEFRVVMPDLREHDVKLRAEVWRLRAEAGRLATEFQMPFRAVWTEILFDGDQEIAERAAERYGIPLDPEAAQAAEAEKASRDAEVQAAALAKAQAAQQGTPPGGSGRSPSDTEERLGALAARAENVREMLALVRGARASSEAARGPDDLR